MQLAALIRFQDFSQRASDTGFIRDSGTKPPLIVENVFHSHRFSVLALCDRSKGQLWLQMK